MTAREQQEQKYVAWVLSRTGGALPVCECGETIPAKEAELMWDDKFHCADCADAWRTEASYEPQGGVHDR